MTTPWRDDPRLAGRFHPQYPDDLQILVHDGGPRFTQLPPELTWARVTGVNDGPATPAGVAYHATLLNAPHHLTSVRAGDSLLFICPPTAPHPLLTSPRYLEERADWRIIPCDRCGLDELFDAPTQLIARIFPNPAEPDAVMQAFTSFCPLCGGVQMVVHKDAAIPDDEQLDIPPNALVPKPPKKWWQFWR